jgi:hypothetical protein
MCVHCNFIWFPSQHNYQNLIHISLCIMSLLVVIVWQCTTCSAYKAIIRQYTLTNIFKLLNCVLDMNSLQYRSWDSVVGIATGYGLDDQGGWNLSHGRVKNFLFPKKSRPVLGSTQPPIQWQGVKRTTHPQLVPRWRKCGSIHPLLHMPSWRSA